MKGKIFKLFALTMTIVFGVCFCFAETIYAEENESGESGAAVDEGGTSISLSPVSNVMSLSSDSRYDDTFEVRNDGKSDMRIEVYAAPYSYIYSEEEDAYKLGFSNENKFTQIARWISFKDTEGNWSKKATYQIAAGKTLPIDYRVITPSNIPAGGQYAVIFAHTLTSADSINGIRTEASPGLVLYGRSTEGENIISAEISDLKIEQSVTENGNTRNNFFASAKVKNTGNVDFSASGKLKVDAILGGGSYETPSERGRISIIPEAELIVSDEWENSPGFGLYKVTWTVTAAGETETIEKIIFVNPLIFVIIVIILLTIITVCIIIGVRKRKERRSRLAV